MLGKSDRTGKLLSLSWLHLKVVTCLVSVCHTMAKWFGHKRSNTVDDMHRTARIYDWSNPGVLLYSVIKSYPI